MAQIHPARIDSIAHSEETVLRQLSRLSDDWIIFHSISWQGLSRGRQGDGEADFIVMNPRFGAAVLEVKGGEITVEDGRWTSTNRHGVHPIKNPFEQAKDSKYTLLRFLADLTSTIELLNTYTDVADGQGLLGDLNNIKDIIAKFEASLFEGDLDQDKLNALKGLDKLAKHVVTIINNTVKTTAVFDAMQAKAKALQAEYPKGAYDLKENDEYKKAQQ